MITVDRTGWPPGPWDGEPDHRMYMDREHGLMCLVIRTYPFGHLCGYVYLGTVACDEPSLENFHVHGGVTWVGALPKTEMPGVWVGFDCAHAWDIVPQMKSLGISDYEGSSYKTFYFVEEQLANLAKQVREYLNNTTEGLCALNSQLQDMGLSSSTGTGGKKVGAP